MKTLALTMIVKNELHNLPRLFKSYQGCFDCAYITDTGSTDGTIDYLVDGRAESDLECKVKLLTFEWINDFSAARNHSLSHIKEDYWLWTDGDDSLGNKDAFLAWKSSQMQLADAWYAPYVYHKDSNTQFIRERVFKTSLGLKFKDPVHEGVDARGVQAQAVDSWKVIHERTEEERVGDQGRNLRILQAQESLSPRMKFYLGKEYFDLHDHKNAAEALMQAVAEEGLEMGDRVLGVQYLTHALIMEKNWPLALKYGHIGMNLSPLRAEFPCLIGDTYIAMNKLMEAIPYYRFALGCINQGNGLTHEFTHSVCYFEHPKTTLAKIYYNLGDFPRALEEMMDINSEEATKFKIECQKAITEMDFSKAQACDDIVITCPMQKAYDWDEEVYKTKGLGGSETAAIEMAKHLKKITGRCVKIFQEREETFVSESGVEYIPTKYLHRYFKKWKPKLHVAWRHNIKMTDAYTAVWCHDLTFPQLREHKNYDVLLALSPFHKNLLISTVGVPADKIHITRNGIEPSRFEKIDTRKQHGKVIWPNSPDRGLEHAIAIMDLVRRELPNAELHCFYGLDNLEKYGLADKAMSLRALIKDRPWVKYIGNVDQKRLAEEFASAEVWIYPASFVESYCISAIESVLCKCYPIVRQIGALSDTLAFAEASGDAEILDLEPTEYETWAKRVVEAIELKKYQEIDYDPAQFSWASVSLEWKDKFNL